MSFPAKEKKEILDKIDKTRVTTKKILDYSDRDNLFKNDQIIKLENIQMELEKLREKLDKETMELSIVGLEGSGKSTFGNTLLERTEGHEVFPTGGLGYRITYTTTEVQHCENKKDEKAIFEHYTKQELRNEIIRLIEILNKDLKEPIDLLREKDAGVRKEIIENIKRESIREETEKLLGEDIEKRIQLYYSEESQKYLNGEPRIFGESEIGGDEYKKLITDTLLAYSIKKNTVYLTNCPKDVIIRDIPGFDSLSGLHSQQTLQALQDADCVVFLKEMLVRVQLKDSEARIINRYIKEEKIKLPDKTFVFGNKIEETQDDANLKKKEVLKSRKETLINTQI